MAELDHLIPFVLTFGPNLEFLDLDVGFDPPIHPITVEDPANADFCQILNYSNQVAFGGAKNMGMPLWVMLDCGILPSAIVGFMVEAKHVGDELWNLLDLDDDYEGFVPVSEYCASLGIEPGSVTGFSLAAALSGHGIATRTKALALAVLGAKSQVGVTQFDNAAIRVHAKFGPMEIVLHRPAVHTHAQNSFVYRLEVPDRDLLIAMARGTEEFGAPGRPEGVHWNFDPSAESDHLRLATHLSEGHQAWIVSPGWRAGSEGCEIDVILGD